MSSLRDAVLSLLKGSARSVASEAAARQAANVAKAGIKTMNVADIVILAVLLVSILIGLMRGFVSEVLSLACWIAAFVVAWKFGETLGNWYGIWIHESVARLVAGYLTCFMGVLIAGALLGWFLRKLIRGSGLSGTDRTLGLLFGLARGVFAVALVVCLLCFSQAPREQWWRQSQLIPSFIAGASQLSWRLPAQIEDYVQRHGSALPVDSHAPISALQQAARQFGTPATAGSTSPPAARTSGRAVGHGPVHGDVGQ
ncbi:MAG: CvpA family protein [Xanthomonadaceae bacterium]|nr:CvpA family protein [Xanthomonadaceae bacterium]